MAQSMMSVGKVTRLDELCELWEKEAKACCVITERDIFEVDNSNLSLL